MHFSECLRKCAIKYINQLCILKDVLAKKFKEINN